MLGEETARLGDYRQRFATYRTDLDLQAAHAAAPWAVTWDDHETENNYADEISENNDPADYFRQRRADAYQAYYEHMPLRPSSLPIGPDMTLFRHLPYGNLADFSVLDTRQYRSDQPCDEGLQPRCPAAMDPATSLLGPEQERWLLQKMEQSPAIWNVLAQQIMMTQLDQTPGDELAFYTDDWNGYPAARDRILNFVQDAAVPNFMDLEKADSPVTEVASWVTEAGVRGYPMNGRTAGGSMYPRRPVFGTRKRWPSIVVTYNTSRSWPPK